MDQTETDHVALLSIHPTYATKIFEGNKKVELRRVGFAQPPRFVLVYVTQPVGKIVGFFEVARVKEATPAEIWSIYREVTGVTKTIYDAYYADRSKAVAIEISTVYHLDEPMDLKEVDDTLQPPQSFRYLEPSVLEQLTSRARASA